MISSKIFRGLWEVLNLGGPGCASSGSSLFSFALPSGVATLGALCPWAEVPSTTCVDSSASSSDRSNSSDDSREFSKDLYIKSWGPIKISCFSIIKISTKGTSLPGNFLLRQRGRGLLRLANLPCFRSRRLAVPRCKWRYVKILRKRVKRWYNGAVFPFEGAFKSFVVVHC